MPPPPPLPPAVAPSLMWLLTMLLLEPLLSELVVLALPSLVRLLERRPPRSMIVICIAGRVHLMDMAYLLLPLLVLVGLCWPRGQQSTMQMAACSGGRLDAGRTDGGARKLPRGRAWNRFPPAFGWLELDFPPFSSCLVATLFPPKLDTLTPSSCETTDHEHEPYHDAAEMVSYDVKLMSQTATTTIDVSCQQSPLDDVYCGCRPFYSLLARIFFSEYHSVTHTIQSGHLLHRRRWIDDEVESIVVVAGVTTHIIFVSMNRITTR